MSENKPDLMAELAEVVRLSDAATAGEWRTEYRKSPRGYGQEVFDSSGATIAELAWHAVPKNETTTTTDREPNAKLIAAAVNFLRTHHAELEAMARDAERYRWLRDECTWALTGGADSTRLSFWTHGVSLAAIGPGADEFDHAIDYAMHNSAREG